MHKKRTIKWAFVAFGILLLLTACGKKNSSETSAASTGGDISKVETAETSTAMIPEDIDYTELDEEGQEQVLKALVQDSFTLEGPLKDGPDNKIDVSYHVPKICFDSAGANAINTEIANVCDDVINREDGDYLSWHEVDYDAYLNGDTLSIILEKCSNLDDYTEYYAYNLDLESGTRLSTKDLAKLLISGIPGEDAEDEPVRLEVRGGETAEHALLRVIRKAAAYEYDQNIRYFYTSHYYETATEEERQGIYAELMRLRMQTLADDNITMDLPMFLDEDGELVVAVPIHVMAGGGIYCCELKPLQTTYQYDAATDTVLTGDEWAEKCEEDQEDGKNEVLLNAERYDAELSFDDAVFINYKDGRMTVRFEQNDWSEAAFGGGNLEFGKEYEVDGVYKDYVNAEILMIMHGEHVVPTFVSNDGMVAYLDLYHGAWGEYFCLTEPVFGLENIEAIAEENADAIATVLEKNMFERSDAYSRDVMGLYEGEGCTTETSFHTDGGTTYTDTFYIGFDPDDPSKFLYQNANIDADLFVNFDGHCTYLGMNEQGLVFCADFYDAEYQLMHYSTFRIRRMDEMNQKTEEWREFMRYQHLGGYDLFGSEGEVRELSFGMG